LTATLPDVGAFHVQLYDCAPVRPILTPPFEQTEAAVKLGDAGALGIISIT